MVKLRKSRNELFAFRRHKLQWWPMLIQLMLLVLQFDSQKVLAENCNELVCGSVVSKCLITQACQCKLADCHCCENCMKCMGQLFVECCTCLDMCPKRNVTFSSSTLKSQIGDFEGVPELFDSLTSEDDKEWKTLRFPMRANLRNRFNNKAAGGGDAIDRHASLQKSKLSVNCTVIYLNACLTDRKCTEYCLSMGSNSYRWFFDGCCECVGANCINYGINESHCTACPDEDEAEIDEAEADYGGDDEGMDNFDYGEDEILNN